MRGLSTFFEPGGGAAAARPLEALAPGFRSLFMAPAKALFVLGGRGEGFFAAVAAFDFRSAAAVVLKAFFGPVADDGGPTLFLVFDAGWALFGGGDLGCVFSGGVIGGALILAALWLPADWEKILASKWSSTSLRRASSSPEFF